MQGSHLNLGRGLNFGCWLSQSVMTQEHFRSFISERDFQCMREWGFENVRLPFDYKLIETDDAPGRYLAEGMAWLDRAIGWAERAGLKLVLDLHRTPGFSFGDALSNPNHVPKLLTDASLQQRFFDIWRTLARRYRGGHDHVVFELLNEITAPQHAQWNELAGRAIAAVREIEPARPIVLGSNRWNSPYTFSDLAKVDDPNIIYSFHFYEPLLFTHQKASWVPACKFYNQQMDYPAHPTDLNEAADRAAAAGQTVAGDKLRSCHEECQTIGYTKPFLASALSHVLAFQKKHNVPLYCGEFGVIYHASGDARYRWYEDFLDLLRQHNIAWAAWCYKDINFGFASKEGEVLEPKLVDLLRQS